MESSPSQRRRKGLGIHDFLYDIRRTITGRFSIIMIILIILIGAAIGYSFGALISSSGGSSTSLAAHGYESSTGDNITIFAYNQYGQPVATQPVSVNYAGQWYNGSTLASGYFYAHPPFNNTTKFFSYGIPGSGASPFAGGEPLYNYTGLNQTLQILSSLSLRTVSNKSSITGNDILALYFGPNGTAAPQISLYYQAANSSSNFVGMPSPFNSTGKTEFGSISNFHNEIISFNVGANSTSSQYYIYAVYNGTVVGYTIIYNSGITPTVLANLFIIVVNAIFALLIPIMAVFSGYLYFGKDKTNGVMESILVKPITKGRIMISRYTSTLTVSLIATALGIVVIDILSASYTGHLVKWYLVGDIIWIYLVVAGGFIGLVYLITQFSRTTGFLLGISLVIYFVMALLWNDIVVLLVLGQLFHLTPGTLAYARADVIAQSLSPSGYGTLVFGYLSGSVSGLTLSTFSISIYEIAAVGVAWLVVPFGIAYYVARKRDWISSQ